MRTTGWNRDSGALKALLEITAESEIVRFCSKCGKRRLACCTQIGGVQARATIATSVSWTARRTWTSSPSGKINLRSIVY